MRDDGSRGGSIMIAIFIALVGLAMYMFQTQENPVTHEKQHVSMSPSDEIKQGLAAAPMMSQKMGGEVSSSDPKTQEVRSIGEYIVSKTDARNSPWKFRFHLLADDKTINAFALPGGQIFITQGLLNKLKTEAQLAGVLSHEMGHVIERHSAQQMAKSQFGNILISAVAVGSGQEHATSAAALAAYVNQLVQLRYSRKDESQADIWGVKLMEQAGFDPKAMVEVLEILKAEDKGGGRMDMFQTHPNPDLRIKQIKEYLAEHPPQGKFSEGKNLNEVFHKSSSSYE